MKHKIKAEKGKGFLGTKERKLTLAFGLFFILIMVASVLNLYEKPDTENTYNYNGIQFANTETGWIGYLKDGRAISIISSPRELENITIDYIPLNRLNLMEKVYVSTNPNDRNREAMSELNKLPISARKVAACYEDAEGCEDYPVKSCNDATDSVGIIVVRESNVTEVSYKYNCLTIQGENLLKLVDKLALQQV